MEAELLRPFDEAPLNVRKQILKSVEYQLARQTDVYAAFEIAYGIVYGSGATKLDRKRAAKKIKQSNAITEAAKKMFEDSN